MRGRAAPPRVLYVPQTPSPTDRLLQDLHGYSLVSLLASLIETRLTLFCTAVKEERSLPTSVEEMDGSLTEKVRDYLQMHLDARAPSELWGWVDDVMRVRRLIVENCGRIDALPNTEQREIVRLTHRRSGVEIETDSGLLDFVCLPGMHSERVLRVRPEFCLDAVTAARGLFGYLYQSRDWEVD